jgi:hypothetical protein
MSCQVVAKEVLPVRRRNAGEATSPVKSNRIGRSVILVELPKKSAKKTEKLLKLLR